MKNPAISVIIPLYNAEKYVGECLESILAQTFQDFEVIVVDDCSTDNSLAVVESYAEKFGGRLRLARTEKNSGSPGEPGNIGLDLARGKYLSILDNDDTITPTAFEELYPIAEDFGADVVACENYYQVPEKYWNSPEPHGKFVGLSYFEEGPVDKPTLIEEDLSERVKHFSERGFVWNLWSKLIRREFLTENKIRFANNFVQDMLATCCMVYAAKKFVIVPNVINNYRLIEDSLSHAGDRVINYFRKYLRALMNGFNYLENFLDGREFFRNNLELKHFALEVCFITVSRYILPLYEKFSPYEFDAVLQKEFSTGDNLSFSSFVFNGANIHRLQLLQTKQKLDDAEKNEQQNKAYIAEMEKFIVQSQQRIAELENELNRLKG